MASSSSPINMYNTRSKARQNFEEEEVEAMDIQATDYGERIDNVDRSLAEISGKLDNLQEDVSKIDINVEATKNRVENIENKVEKICKDIVKRKDLEQILGANAIGQTTGKKWIILKSMLPFTFAMFICPSWR